MIKLQVIGNLGRDCTVNNVNGRTVINFSVAHTERYRDSTTGEFKPKTIWVECAYWTDKTAIVPYLKKGTQVYAEGTPDTRNYQTQSGENKTSLTLRIQNVQLLGSRSGEGNNPQEGGSSGGNSSSSSSSTSSNNAGSTENSATPSSTSSSSSQESGSTPSSSQQGDDSDDLPF